MRWRKESSAPSGQTSIDLPATLYSGRTSPMRFTLGKPGHLHRVQWIHDPSPYGGQEARAEAYVRPLLHRCVGHDSRPTQLDVVPLLQLGDRSAIVAPSLSDRDRPPAHAVTFRLEPAHLLLVSQPSRAALLIVVELAARAPHARGSWSNRGGGRKGGGQGSRSRVGGGGGLEGREEAHPAVERNSSTFARVGLNSENVMAYSPGAMVRSFDNAEPTISRNCRG